MNTEIEVMRAAWRLANLRSRTAPSLRVPVTAGNRALLRRLRSAELSAWEAVDRRSHRSSLQ